MDSNVRTWIMNTVCEGGIKMSSKLQSKWKFIIRFEKGSFFSIKCYIYICINVKLASQHEHNKCIRYTKIKHRFVRFRKNDEMCKIFNYVEKFKLFFFSLYMFKWKISFAREITIFRFWLYFTRNCHILVYINIYSKLPQTHLMKKSESLCVP